MCNLNFTNTQFLGLFNQPLNSVGNLHSRHVIHSDDWKRFPTVKFFFSDRWFIILRRPQVNPKKTLVSKNEPPRKIWYPQVNLKQKIGVHVNHKMATLATLHHTKWMSAGGPHWHWGTGVVTTGAWTWVWHSATSNLWKWNPQHRQQLWKMKNHNFPWNI